MEQELNFSCIALFVHTCDNPNRVAQFEERVLMVAASSEKEAEQLFLSEIAEYAVDGTEFLDEYQIREMYPSENRVIEVASSMKVFPGSHTDYVAKHWYDQRPENCESVGWSHVKYKRNELSLSCYNCQMEFESER